MTRVDGTVLITGATGGIGQAIARGFAARGAKLILTGRRVEVLEPLARELGARTIAADLASRTDIDRLVSEVGQLDVLVANAALQAGGYLTDLTQSQIDTLIEVNLRAPVALTRAFAPSMIERRSGQIVLIGSLNGMAASPAAPIYNATKFGLRGFALGMREDLRASGVGVSLILPGFISDAGMFADSGAPLPPGAATRTPEQVADAVITAVKRNRGEVMVAPLMLRVGTQIASVAPGLAAFAQRLAGGHEVSQAIAEGSRDKLPDA